jgi:hypothetical protein
MEEKDQQQADFDDWNERVAFESERVLVEGVLPPEDHQVSEDVNDEVHEQGETGDADEELHPHRRIEHATT